MAARGKTSQLKKHVTRLLAFAVVVMLIYAFFAFDLGDYLTLEYIKSRQAIFAQYYQQHRLQTIAVYFAIYVLVTGLSLPGATIMTLAGGAMFGLLLGVVVISFASSIGATCAFLVARFLLRDYVQDKYADKLAPVNEGIRKDGAFYLFTLRLIPLFPFFIINLVMGLTPIRVWTYYFVSQLGMLLGTVVYVNAGTQLGRIESVQGIVSPEIIASFVLLGLLPLVSRKFIEALKSRRYRKHYKRPRRYDYNLAVLGAGSGGLVAAYIGAAVKARTLLIEKAEMGGDCLNTGCVPSKALIQSARVLSYAAQAPKYGFRSAHVDFEFAEVMERVQRVISKIAPHDSVARYTKLGVDCIQGRGKLLSPYEIAVGDRVISARNIVIATGGRPAVPSIPGIEEVEYFTSDTIWDVRELPNRLLVLGGGPIGCELAQCFQRFGADVTLVQRRSQLLPAEDPDIAEYVYRKFAAEGMTVLLEQSALEFTTDNDVQRLLCRDGDGNEQALEFDQVLLALGRSANTEGFGLEELGIPLSARGTIETNEFMQTVYPNVFVCGDVAGPYQFTHTASHQAWYAAVNALFRPFKRFRVDYRVIPWATYTDPEVARVGLSEAEARRQGIPYEVTTYSMSDLDRAITDEADEGLVKVLTQPGKDRLLGAAVVGAHASDTIIEFVAAMKYGFGLNKILGTIHIYPTFAEANKFAAGNWKRAHVSPRVLDMLEWFHRRRRH